LAGTAKPNDIPPDLKGKLYLDLRQRSISDYNKEIDKLIRAILGENSYGLASAYPLAAVSYSKKLHGYDRDYDFHPIEFALRFYSIKKKWYLDKTSLRAGLYLERGMYPSSQMRISIGADRVQRMLHPVACEGTNWELRMINDTITQLRLTYGGFGVAGNFSFVIGKKDLTCIEHLALGLLNEDDAREFSIGLKYFRNRQINTS
jgi:hypothetical protein